VLEAQGALHAGKHVIGAGGTRRHVAMGVMRVHSRGVCHSSNAAGMQIDAVNLHGKAGTAHSLDATQTDSELCTLWDRCIVVRW
jgi:hypothetical protein